MSSADFWVGPFSAPQTYRLVSLLGGGGEGEVWRAELPLSTGGRRHVAVKIQPSVGDADEPARWERFGHLLTSLGHPGLVRVTDVFLGAAPHRGDEPARDAAPRRYIVMDHVEGPTLREWCDENPDATASTRLRMLRTIASALDEMHAGAGTEVPVAHGDVKPSNVVVRPDGGTILVDLGLTRLTDGTGVAGHSAPYAAPELRLPGALATPEADRYAFAATTAQVLTGQAPPTGPEGWLDLVELENLLRSSPISHRRPALIKQILDVLTAPPEARPRNLRSWLDATNDALSRMTTSETTGSRAATSPDAETAPPVGAVTATAPRFRRWIPVVVVAASVVAVVAVVGVVGLTRGSAGVAAPTTPSVTHAAQAALAASPSAAPTATPVEAIPDPVVQFISPPQNTPLKVGQGVSIRGSVSGLRGRKLWLLTQSSLGGTDYYTVEDSATADKDGDWALDDSGVGDPTDVGGLVTYYPIVADSACNSALYPFRQNDSDVEVPPVSDLPPTCVRLPGLSFRIVS